MQNRHLGQKAGQNAQGRQLGQGTALQGCHLGQDTALQGCHLGQDAALQGCHLEAELSCLASLGFFEKLVFENKCIATCGMKDHNPHKKRDE